MTSLDPRRSPTSLGLTVAALLSVSPAAGCMSASHASTDPDASVADAAPPSPDATSIPEDVVVLADAAVSADAVSPPDAHDLPDAAPFVDEDAPDAYPSWVRG